MEEIDRIRARIQSDQKETDKVPVKEKGILRVFNVALLLVLLGVCTLIYCKADEDATVFNQLFHTEVSFREMNAAIRGCIDRLFFRGGEEQTQQTVGAQVEYVSLGNNRYSSADGTIRMLRGGTLVTASYQNEYEYFLVVQYENQVSALYTLVSEVSAEAGSALKQNDVLGAYAGEYFNCIFKKGDNILSYSDAIL